MFTEGHEDRGRELSVRLGNVEGGGTFPIGFIFPVVDMQLMHDHTEDNVLDEVIEERRTHNFAFPGMVGEALEVRLAGCLTALEAILLGDDDYSNHVTYIARRLSALTGFYEFDDISCLHGARQGPVHRAERNLAGKVVVLAEEVDKLRFTVRQALMAILTPPAG